MLLQLVTTGNCLQLGEVYVISVPVSISINIFLKAANLVIVRDIIFSLDLKSSYYDQKSLSLPARLKEQRSKV